MKQYLELLKDILQNGIERQERTGIGTKSVFGRQIRYNLEEGFPLLTTKKVSYKSIIHELLWFLKGDTNIKYLVENNVNIWNEWPYQMYLSANELTDIYPMYSPEWKARMKEFIKHIKTNDEFAKQWGDLGPVYGKQWTAWQNIDGTTFNQIANAVEMLKTNPNSRRIIVSGWNAGDIQALVHNPIAPPPPCHTLFQFFVLGEKLHLQLYQRSADVFLGVPFNIASYSLLLTMMAQVTNLKAGEFVHTIGDAHIYLNHLTQVNEQLSREPKQLPKMIITPSVNDIFGFIFEDFRVEGYDPHPKIKGDIAV